MLIIVIVILSSWFSLLSFELSQENPPIWFDGNELFVCLFVMYTYVCVVIRHFVNNVLEIVVLFYLYFAFT